MTETETAPAEVAETPKKRAKAKTEQKPANGNRHPIVTIRLAGVPLVAWETPDPADTMRACQKAVTDADPEPADEYCFCAWNIIQGVYGLNKAGVKYAAAVSPNGAIDTANPAEALSIVAKNKTPNLILFFQNAHRFVDNESVAQAIWNLRDVFKSNAATLVLLAPTIRLPAELQRDVVLISEALPNEEQLAKVLDAVVEDAKLPKVEGEERTLCIDTLLGLSAFEAEQTVALSCRKSGVDRALLWERKVKAVEQTNGLTIYRGKEKFADVGGLENAKKILAQTIRGKTNITAVVFIDEIDKGMAAAGSDTSGTTQDQLKVLLSYLQDNDVLGMLLLGPPGTGKTVLAKSAANEHGIPLVMFDLGAMKGSLVGQSEQNMRAAIKVVHAISAGRALFVGACNRTEGLPPELRRRFNYASLFVDLPDSTERKVLWDLWAGKYKLTPEQRNFTKDEGWTGAEIRNACLKAWATDITLADAAQTIVPVAKSAEDRIMALRKSATGKYTSASKPGLYVWNEGDETPATGRKMTAN